MASFYFWLYLNFVFNAYQVIHHLFVFEFFEEHSEEAGFYLHKNSVYLLLVLKNILFLVDGGYKALDFFLTCDEKKMNQLMHLFIKINWFLFVVLKEMLHPIHMKPLGNWIVRLALYFLEIIFLLLN